MVRVLYIAGFGRSGSTLLSRMLGQLPGVVSIGELQHIWRTGAIARSPNELCGCGQAFAACSFWDAVLDEAFAASRPAADEIRALRQRVDRIRYVPLMLLHRRPRQYEQDLEHYSDLVLRLYKAIGRVGEGDVIVDAGKDVSPLYLLATMPDLDVRVVHLVRDPRGVGFSWARRVRRAQYLDGDAFMDTYGPVDVSVRWVYTNVLTEAARMKHAKFLRVRYEDLLADPELWLRRVAGHAEIDATELPLVHRRLVDLSQPDHLVSGNPMRFQKGPIELRLDDAWRSQQRRVPRLILSGMTWPLRRRYGYRDW